MSVTLMPTIGCKYKDVHGNIFEVIGMGTKGIVIEFIDGQSRLVDLATFQQNPEELTQIQDKPSSYAAGSNSDKTEQTVATL